MSFLNKLCCLGKITKPRAEVVVPPYKWTHSLCKYICLLLANETTRVICRYLYVKIYIYPFPANRLLQMLHIGLLM